jgi:hypothetical protein
MKLTEAKIKKIIFEEVTDRLIEIEAQKFITVLREELAKEGILLTEAQDEATEAEAAAILEKELAAIKDDARKKWWKSTIKKAIAAGVSLTILLPFFHKVEVDRPAQTRAEHAANIEDYRSSEKTNARFHDKLTNPEDLGANWIWKAADGRPVAGDAYTFPTDPHNPQTALMPLDWSIGWDVLKDSNSDTSKYPMPQELLQIMAEGPEITPEMDGKEIAKVQDSYTTAALKYYRDYQDKGSKEFFTVFSPNDWKDAGEHGIHGYTSVHVTQPSATYPLLDQCIGTGEDQKCAQKLQDIQFVPAERIPDGYTMHNGLNPQQQYEKFKYVDLLSLQDFIEYRTNLQK